ncbi:MAG: four helix bundle protein [Bacteroidota bacterium]|jgi:four helix bundle protein
MENKITFEKLVVWQKGIKLSKDIYQAVKNFPTEELFGITNQLKRSSVSIPSNIAEGYGRNSRADYKRFLCIALGSVYELQTQIIISKELGLINEIKFKEIITLSKEIDRMLYAIIKKL